MLYDHPVFVTIVRNPEEMFHSYYTYFGLKHVSITEPIITIKKYVLNLISSYETEIQIGDRRLYSQVQIQEEDKILLHDLQFDVV